MCKYIQISTAIIILFVSSSSTHLMGDAITCWEQNKEDPTGFKDPEWNDPTSNKCIANPALCTFYQTQLREGDVCDTDQRNNLQQDWCYFNVIFGQNVNLEKTWSYKCWASQGCPLRDTNGPIPGCLITHKRITCCCTDDYCNGQELFLKYAQWGRSELYPPDMTEILSYPTGDVYTEYRQSGTKTVFS
eukprot:252405_1